MDRRNIAKRRGKPNRGGGRHNQGHGAHHGGHSRKGDLDFDNLMDGPVLQGSRGGRHNHGGHSRNSDFDLDDWMDGPVLQGNSAGRDQPIPTGKPTARGRGRGQPAQTRNITPVTGNHEPKVKAELQHLHMTTENQKMVHDVLKSLRDGDNDSVHSDSECDELDTRSDEHYWQTKVSRVVKSDGTYLSHIRPKETSRQAQTISSADVNLVVLQKLERCGFSRSLCQEAIQVCDGDLGAALEYLLTELKSLDGTAKLSSSSPLSDGKTEIPEDIWALREEEKMALQSIFEHRFVERLVNRVWVLHLELPELKQLLNFGGSGATLASSGFAKKEVQSVREVCRFYKRGMCRFGDRCKNQHVRELSMSKKSEELQGPLADSLFVLEIRFPVGNRYPKEAPLLAFSSVVGRIPPYCCLNISRFLMKCAQKLADEVQPAIYSLVSFLENSEQLQTLLEMPPSPLADPSLLLAHDEMELSSPDVDAKPCRQKTFAKTSLGNGKPSYRRDETVLVEQSSRKECGSFSSQGKRKEIRAEENDDQGSDKPDPQHSSVKSAWEKPMNNMTGSCQASLQEKQAHVLKQNKKLKEDFRMKASNQSYQKRIANRQKLPTWDYQDEVLAAIEENQVVVISGMTGCGKTTQVPQFILDKYLKMRDLRLCNIVCTQPRRISAISVAERVAYERIERLGNSVGYQIRLESVQSPATRLLFCTTGIILRRLEGDSSLSDVTHLIVDEVHERSEESDFLLMILRDILPKRPDLKVILMSATLNADLFSSYFNYCPVVEIPGKTFPVKAFFLEDVIEMTKFTVEDKAPSARFQPKPLPRSGNRNKKSRKGPTLSYADAIEESLKGLSLDDESDEYDDPSDKWTDEKLNVKQLSARYSDYSKRTIRCLANMDYEKINFDLIVTLLEWIVAGNHQFPKQAAVLVFLPGFAEIQTLLDALISSSEFGHRNRSKYKIVPLHSSLSTEEQNSVFMRPQEGVTKIVIATNIAETSITIDDIVYVIDSGRMKEKRYDAARSMESLETVWVSKANALQRRGRAGRVMSGVCFHLFTNHRFENVLREQPIPEIQRVPLEQLMLRIKMLDIFSSHEATEVLSKVMEPPCEEAMKNAIHRLQDIGALDEKGSLTALGYHLGSLPLDVRLGKLMVFGSIFRCLDASLTIAAALSFKSPFVSPFDKKTEAAAKKKEFAVGNSDYLTILNAYNQWLEVKKQGKQEEHRFCHENFMSQKTLQMLASLKQQYLELLSDIGFTDAGIKLRNIQRAAREFGGDGVLNVTGQDANANIKNWKLISAVLVAALYPNVMRVMSLEARIKQSIPGSDLKFETRLDGQVHIHPSSVNFQEHKFESPYLVYHEKVKTSKVYIRDCTMVSVYSLLLLGGGQISSDLHRGNFILSMDKGWIRFVAASSQIAQLLQQLRLELDQLLQDKIKSPNMNLSTCPRGSKIIDTIVKLLTTQ